MCFDCGQSKWKNAELTFLTLRCRDSRTLDNNMSLRTVLFLAKFVIICPTWPNALHTFPLIHDSSANLNSFVRFNLRGGSQPHTQHLSDSDSWEPEHRFLHPDQLMLDENFDDRMNFTRFERIVMNRTRTWMRDLLRREKQEKESGTRPPYADVSEFEVDSDEYKFYQNESNPNRFENGCAPRQPT
jgi:hypothetical protein